MPYEPKTLFIVLVILIICGMIIAAGIEAGFGIGLIYNQHVAEVIQKQQRWRPIDAASDDCSRQYGAQRQNEG